jgi:hypothetical protein
MKKTLVIATIIYTVLCVAAVVMRADVSRDGYSTPTLDKVLKKGNVSAEDITVGEVNGTVARFNMYSGGPLATSTNYFASDTVAYGDVHASGTGYFDTAVVTINVTASGNGKFTGDIYATGALCMDGACNYGITTAGNGDFNELYVSDGYGSSGTTISGGAIDTDGIITTDDILIADGVEVGGGLGSGGCDIDTNGNVDCDGYVAADTGDFDSTAGDVLDIIATSTFIGIDVDHGVGAGDGIDVKMVGSGNAIHGVIYTPGTGNAINGYNYTGNGRAGYFHTGNATSTQETVLIENAGKGLALMIETTNPLAKGSIQVQTQDYSQEAWRSNNPGGNPTFIIMANGDMFSSGSIAIATGTTMVTGEFTDWITVGTGGNQVHLDDGNGYFDGDANIDGNIVATGTADIAGGVTTAGNATAAYFFGDGSGLTGVSGTDNTRVLSAGDTMTGQLKIENNILMDGNITAATGTLTISDEVVAGDVLYSGAGSGVAYAELYAADNATVTAIATQNQWYQVESFNTNGPYNRLTPDHTTDDITISDTGVYEISVDISIHGIADQAYEYMVKKNNGTGDLTSTHMRQYSIDTNNRIISLSGLASLTALDTIELWIMCPTSAAANAMIHYANFRIKMIGG